MTRGATETYAFTINDYTPAIRDRVSALSNRRDEFETIPVIFVETDEERARKILELEGVTGIHPRPTKAQMRTVSAMNDLLLFTDMHRTILRPNGVASEEDRKANRIPPYPILEMSTTPPSLRFDPSVQLPTRLSVLAALNMSVSPKPPIEFKEEDPVNVATKAASQALPVVMAAGNREDWHPHPQIDGWAEAPWLISVGATSDPEGENLAPYSLVGWPDRPDSGPTVVAYGTDAVSGRKGTSFAAPRVSEELAVLTAYWLTLRHYLQREGIEPVEGIPLVGIGYVDVDVLPGRGDEHGYKVADIAPPKRAMPALPAAGINQDAVKAVVGIVLREEIRLNLVPIAERLTSMLIASARPFRDLERFQVGHGFISETTTEAYLMGFSAADLLALTGARVSASGARELAQCLLTNQSELPALIAAWRLSIPKWIIDLKDFSHENRRNLMILDRFENGRWTLRPPSDLLNE